MLYSKPIKSLNDIYNTYTLNIFSDASMRRATRGVMAGCYGVVAVSRDDILEKMYRIHSNTTSNQEELRGIRGSVRLALKYHQYFKVINFFSDSLISVDLFKNFNKYRYNECTNLIYSNYSKRKPLENQSLIVEISQLMRKLMDIHPETYIYHQKGHIPYNNKKALDKAARKFRTINNIKNNIDLNLSRYLSIYNDMVDHESRSLLNRTNVYNDYYQDPVEFFAIKKITL